MSLFGSGVGIRGSDIVDHKLLHINASGQIVDGDGNAIDLVFFSRSSGLINGFLDKDLAYVSTQVPSHTLSELQALSPSSYADQFVLVTDLGNINANALLVSNGVRWVPATGRQLLFKQHGTIASPISTISGATGTFSTAQEILIPANLLDGGKSRLYVKAAFERTGNNGTMTLACMLGTDTSTPANNSIVSGFNVVAGTPAYPFIGTSLFFGTDTTFTTTGNASMGGSGLTSTMFDRNTLVNVAAIMELNFIITAINAADSIKLLFYELWWEED